MDVTQSGVRHVDEGMLGITCWCEAPPVACDEHTWNDLFTNAFSPRPRGIHFNNSIEKRSVHTVSVF